MSKVYRKVGNDYIEVESASITPDIIAAKLNQNFAWNVFVTNDQTNTKSVVTLLFVSLFLVFIFCGYLIWFRYAPVLTVVYFTFCCASIAERKMLVLVIPATLFVYGAWIG